jgi:uncharacterized protein (UPF0303 family)
LQGTLYVTITIGTGENDNSEFHRRKKFTVQRYDFPGWDPGFREVNIGFSISELTPCNSSS